ncbi:MAG: phosphatidate cytidylyltransferase [Planctomycetota bacterium]
MDPVSRERLFGFSGAFDSPVTLWGTVAVAAALIAAPLVTLLLHRLGKIDDAAKRELMLRNASWAVIAPALLVPLLLGAAWWIAGLFVLSVLCLREFGRITGLFREPLVMAAAYLGLASTYFGALDHWYAWFIGSTPVAVAAILAAAVLSDRPKGYVQRVAVATTGFVLFGTGLGHLALLANDAQFRPMLFIILAAVEGNDVFAYVFGKTLGRRKLCPNTSPGKTVAGAVGAVVCTTTLVVVLGHFLVTDGMARWWPHLVAAGVLVSVAGQLGDLVISSVKRDVGIKDTGTLLPGHGGLLDRFDSLVFTAPVITYFIAYFRGIGTDQPSQIFTLGVG